MDRDDLKTRKNSLKWLSVIKIFINGQNPKLKNLYPKNFWASPYEFFYDGSLLNCGSDWALMPSKFEPGGIV